MCLLLLLSREGFESLPRGRICLLEVFRLRFHLTEDPILLKELLLLLEEALEFGELVVVANVEAKRHRWINLRIVDLLR